ncbi:MAG TPA: transcriptional regulator FilR1 domain-containing protein [Methanoregulaceae archaeon]|nr:transcriptional regulator FilR1 domain-containing protein [Methanoregulaceae archaeon]
MTLIDTYSKVMGEIQSLYRSRLQIQILLSLYEENRTLSQLREITGSTSQALIPKIRKLESNNYIDILDYEYYLTPIGRILAGKMSELIMFQAIINKHKGFWSEHYIEGIPEPFLYEIGELYESEVVSDTNIDIFNVFFNFLKAVKEAQKICILSPISSPAHTDAVARRVGEGIPVELIVGKELAEQFFQSPYIEMIQELAANSGSKILVLDEPLKIGLTVTDGCVSLGLYRNDAITYDTTTDVFSHDKKAVLWGERLFEYFRSKATELKFS